MKIYWQLDPKVIEETLDVVFNIPKGLGTQKPSRCTHSSALLLENSAAVSPRYSKLEKADPDSKEE
jgi:hypothetical protein